MKKVLFIYVSYFLKKLIEDGLIENDLTLDFYESDRWHDRGNSTERLIITNYQAISKIEIQNVTIEQIAIINLKDFFLKRVLEFDLVFFNQFANNKSHEITADFIDFCDKNKLDKKVIFGTEVTWFNELNRGKYNFDQVKYVYEKARLLRHTAKTDRYIYINNMPNNIIEFEIGLDADLVASNKSIVERDCIVFVLGPEDRGVKNNSLIDEIISSINSSFLGDKYRICKVIPPYLTPDLWSIYDNAKYLIFTSNSETFSYVLNDAKSKGVITFFPEHMYYNTIGSSFSVNSYPESGIRYRSVSNLMEKIERLDCDISAQIIESKKSRNLVESSFSVKKISDNYKKIIEGISLRVNNCYVYSSHYDSFNDYSDFVSFCLEGNIKYVVIFDNDKNIFPSFDSISYYDSLNDIVIHWSCFYFDLSGNKKKKISYCMDSGFYTYAEDGGLIDFDICDGLICFFRLFLRINKIRKINSSKGLRLFILREFNLDLDLL